MRPVLYRPSGSGAFTLIEVLIALAVVAVVVVALNTVFYGALRLRTKVTDAIESTLPLEPILAIMKKDIQSMVPPTGPLSGQLSTSSFSSSGGQARGATLLLYTASATLREEEPWSEVQKVEYYLKKAENPGRTAGQDLVRSVTRNLLATVQEQPEEQWMAGGIQSVTFTYFDGQSWINSWDATTSTNLPAAIKVQIEFTADPADQKLVIPIEMVVPIMAQTLTNLPAVSQ